MHQLASPVLRPGTRRLLAASLLPAAVLAAEARGWVAPAGVMPAPRSAHTATYVGTGRVLLAGGLGPAGRLATADEYDPASGSFLPAAPMPEARRNHTATLLRNGKVLVAGGSGAAGSLVTCLLYDPRDRTWAYTGVLGAPRQDHTATLLLDGRVLVAGGQNGTTPLASAELYDPSTGSWQTAGGLGTARYGHAAVLLPDGRVLVAGGRTRTVPAEYTATAALFSPVSGVFGATGSMASARSAFTLTLIPGGLVVAAGGRASSGLSSAERYNVSTGAWGSAGDLGESRYGHSAVLLPDGRVLVAGGQGSASALGSMAEYDPAGNSWSAVETGGARTGHTATLLPGGRVLVAGGVDAATWRSDAEVVDRANASWSAAPWGFGRVDGTATPLPSGKVLVLGKSPFSPTGGSLFDPVSDTWTYTAGAMKVPRSQHTATLLPDGSVLIVGGRSLATGALASADEVYDPGTDAFYQLAFSLPVADRKSFHEAVLLADGRVLVGGGEADGVFKPFLRSPSTTAWSAVPGPPVIPSSSRVRMTLLANGKVLVTSPDPEVWVFDPGPGGGWRLAARKEYRSNGHQALLLPSGDVLLCYQDTGVPFGLYDVESETVESPWPWLTVPPGAAYGFTAAVLPDGRVLRAGGMVPGGPALALAHLLDPSTGTVTQLPPMAEARLAPELALLPDGRVLAAGGFLDFDTYSVLPSSEVLRVWPGLAASSRPVVSSIPPSLAEPASLTLGGTGFRGVAEATGGNGTASSSAGVPSLLLRRLEGGIARWAPSSPGASWSATSFPSAALSGLPGGHYAATLFASGIASVSRAVPLTACEPSTGVLASTPAASVCEGQTLVLSAKDVPGAAYLWTLPDGSSAAGRVLTIAAAGPEDGGLYTVVATKDGCASPPDGVFVRVAPTPQPPVLQAPAALAPSQEAEASVALHAGSAYAWTLSGGTLLAGQGTHRIRFRAPSSPGSVTIGVTESVGASCVQPAATATVPVGQPAWRFYAAAPCRLLDTREPAGPSGAAPALAPGESRAFTVGTRCGLDAATVRALAVNQTVVTPAADGFLALYRADMGTPPLASSINFRAGQTRANNGILELSRSGDGGFVVKNGSAGAVHFVLDVNGTFR